MLIVHVCNHYNTKSPQSCYIWERPDVFVLVLKGHFFPRSITARLFYRLLVDRNKVCTYRLNDFIQSSEKVLADKLL